MAKFKDYFNSTTANGRANVAKATYASFAALYLYTRFTRNKKKLIETQGTFESSEKLEDFKCPNCERNNYKKNNGLKVNSGQELREATSSVGSYDSNKSESIGKPDNVTSVAESIMKSSKSKSYYGGNQFEDQNGDDNQDSPTPGEGSCGQENRY